MSGNGKSRSLRLPSYGYLGHSYLRTSEFYSGFYNGHRYCSLTNPRAWSTYRRNRCMYTLSRCSPITNG